MHWTTSGNRVEDPALAQIDVSWDDEMSDLQDQAELEDIRHDLNDRGLLIAA